ncbi:BnaC03g69510D [Brassica napus]|uniref:BnaC03g69510D protein n=1 Tax=Brassica napus TaxID=3708 RepID=A0A078GKD2_BRANA|nr:BnaC03g69510D [Brassica napus]
MWSLLWTTEKEQLFIIEKAGIVGTRAGEVLQVIDVRKGTLNNVITFPPVIDPSQRPKPFSQLLFVTARIAVLRGSNWEIPLPPFGKGWFENVYMDGDIRVVKDIRGDYLVVDCAPFNWKE